MTYSSEQFFIDAHRSLANPSDSLSTDSSCFDMFHSGPSVDKCTQLVSNLTKCPSFVRLASCVTKAAAPSLFDIVRHVFYSVGDVGGETPKSRNWLESFGAKPPSRTFLILKLRHETPTVAKYNYLSISQRKIP